MLAPVLQSVLDEAFATTDVHAMRAARVERRLRSAGSHQPAIGRWPGKVAISQSSGGNQSGTSSNPPGMIARLRRAPISALKFSFVADSIRPDASHITLDRVRLVSTRHSWRDCGVATA